MYEKMKKCCFVIPYFGKLPNYFQLFLNSCKYNQDYNWLLFTDDNSEFVYPSNVQRILIDFEELKEAVNKISASAMTCWMCSRFADITGLFVKQLSRKRYCAVRSSSHCQNR